MRGTLRCVAQLSGAFLVLIVAATLITGCGKADLIKEAPVIKGRELPPGSVSKK
jgi:hypothetical protein